jgi:hypothetical protein
MSFVAAICTEAATRDVRVMTTRELETSADALATAERARRIEDERLKGRRARARAGWIAR